MRKRIDGRLYDTNSAQKIATYSFLGNKDDSYTEILFLKRTGEYFIHGAGAKDSIYGIHTRRRYMAAEKLVPVTKEQAMEWECTHQKELIRCERYVQLTLKLPETMVQQLENKANANGITVDELILSSLQTI